MKKITNENYSIPKIFATEWLEVLETGTTEPALILGIDKLSMEKGSYVLKHSGNSRMSPQAACRELIGAWIGLELGLNVFEPVLIEVSTDFAQTLRGGSYFQKIIKSVGINFGTKFVPGCIDIHANSNLNNPQVEQAKQIIAFDTFISNADRGAAKPNITSKDADLFIFDHELAFSFIYLLSFQKNFEPWELKDAEIALLNQHTLYSRLRKSNINFTEFIGRFETLNENFWKLVELNLPNEWVSEEFDTIKQHLTLIINNRSIFAQKLTSALLT